MLGVLARSDRSIRVARHKGALDAPYNQAMLARLRSGSKSPHDISFFFHELKEASFMDSGIGAAEAHDMTLRWQGIEKVPGYESNIYAPEVIAESREWFNRAAWPK